MYMNVLPVCMYVCTPCACLVPTEARKRCHALELKVRMTWSHLVGARS